MRRRGEDASRPGSAEAECFEGVSGAAGDSLQTFVRTLAHPQRSTVLVIALSLIAVGVQTWQEDVILSRVLVLIGIFIAPAAVAHMPAPAEVLYPHDPDMDKPSRPEAEPLEEAPQALAMDPDDELRV
mmetsp:Transcript_56982/g.133296  ORF Transcript_56982/g.133296 Transcript_56982/m.133296 type:complete len:128 (+) Transcript_56982:73-456(+)